MYVQGPLQPQQTQIAAKGATYWGEGCTSLAVASPVMLSQCEVRPKLVIYKSLYTRVDTVALSVSPVGTTGLGGGLRFPIAESIGFCDKHLLSASVQLMHYSKGASFLLSNNCHIDESMIDSTSAMYTRLCCGRSLFANTRSLFANTRSRSRQHCDSKARIQCQCQRVQAIPAIDHRLS